MASLDTGNGEVAIKSNSNIKQWAIDIHPQFNSKQPVQVLDINHNIPIKNIPVKEG
jgi:hypothetical protein